MDTRTGAIANFERASDAKRAGYDIKLKKEEAAKLLTVPRRERRAELSKMRREKRRAQRAARKANRGK